MEPLVHSLFSLALATRENDPTGADLAQFGGYQILPDFQGGREGLAGLAGEHPELEAAVIVHIAPLIGQQDCGHGYASPR